MTNRERVIGAIRFQKTDYVPHTVSFTAQAYEKTLRAYGESFMQKLNDHISLVNLSKPEVSVRPGYDRDEYGVVWNKTGADKDIGIPDHYWITDEASLAAYTFPPVDEAFIRAQCETFKQLPADNFRGCMIGFSMFERLWTLMGMENTLCNMALEPDLVHTVLSRICDRNMAILDIALDYDFDCFHFGDDWGQQKGLIMGPTYWRAFIKPYVARMYARVRQSGKFVSQHSCGDIRLIMDDLYEMGLNIYQTFQPEIYGLDYADVLRGKIAVWGAISTQQDMPTATPEVMKAITQETINRFKGVGLIISPTHAIPGDVPAENIAAMVSVFLSQQPKDCA